MGERASHLRRVGVGLGAVVVGGLVVVGLLPGVAAAGDEGEGPAGTPVAGNPTCAELGEFDAGFKIDAQPEVGETYDDPGSDFEVTITDVGDGDPMTVSFEANVAVSAVFVKAGPGGLLYVFDPASSTGAGLVSPKDSISHVSFCWDDGRATTTTTGQDGSTTTTGQDGSTTTTGQDGSTTTTGQDGSTTTTGQDGSTTTTGHDGSTPTTQPGGPTTSAPEVEGTTPSTQPVGDDELPRTGSNTGLLIAVAGGLVACGAALVVTTRRMRHT